MHVPAPVGREDGRPLAFEREGGDAVVGVQPRVPGAQSRSDCGKGRGADRSRSRPGAVEGEPEEPAGCSRRYLERHFRAKLGRSVHDEMLLARLDRVKELLETTSLSIGEVAAVCGFARASQLAALFRKATGTTMRAWRREHRETPDE